MSDLFDLKGPMDEESLLQDLNDEFRRAWSFQTPDQKPEETGMQNLRTVQNDPAPEPERSQTSKPESSRPGKPSRSHSLHLTNQKTQIRLDVACVRKVKEVFGYSKSQSTAISALLAFLLDVPADQLSPEVRDFLQSHAPALQAFKNTPAAVPQENSGTQKDLHEMEARLQSRLGQMEFMLQGLMRLESLQLAERLDLLDCSGIQDAQDFNFEQDVLEQMEKTVLKAAWQIQARKREEKGRMVYTSKTRREGQSL